MMMKDDGDDTNSYEISQQRRRPKGKDHVEKIDGQCVIPNLILRVGKRIQGRRLLAGSYNDNNTLK